MKPLRTTTTAIVVLWLCGSLFAIWLTFAAKSTAHFMVAADEPTWSSFLVGIPWFAVWLAVAAVLAGLAWAAASLAKTSGWVAYAYAGLVAATLAVLYWATVVLPPSTLLLVPL